jgi:anthranilate phosphoribosyltransferase
VREELVPEELGLTRALPEDVAGHDVEENARLTVRILSGSLPREDPRVQMVLANAAAGFVLCDKTKDFRDGVELAAQSMKDGEPLRKLRELIAFSKGNPDRLAGLA